jgi:hypothetical protein
MYSLTDLLWFAVGVLVGVAIGLTLFELVNAGPYDPCDQSMTQPYQPQPFGGVQGPVTPNAYGPGLHSDATGKPFVLRPW